MYKYVYMHVDLQLEFMLKSYVVPQGRKWLHYFTQPLERLNMLFDMTMSIALAKTHYEQAAAQSRALIGRVVKILEP